MNVRKYMNVLMEMCRDVRMYIVCTVYSMYVCMYVCTYMCVYVLYECNVSASSYWCILSSLCR